LKKTTFRILFSIIVCAVLSEAALAAGELARLVRLKISAGDLLSGVAAVEDYKRKNGVDTEYLDAIGWLARGAEMLKQPDVAAQYVAELRREIREEKPELLLALGSAIEVEGRLRAGREGREPAVKFLEQEYARAKDISLQSRIRKSINQLTLEGSSAPEIKTENSIGPTSPGLAALKGKPVPLFLWAHWCGDCRAQADVLARINKKYKSQLVIIAPTRFYGTGQQNRPATPKEEKLHMQKVWAESYPGLEDVSITIDTDTMVRYGVSATPTFALIDRKGIVRFYTPTRLSEAELSNRIDSLLK
jgi:thiol-disulfide isomerase/thioredoxin